MSAFAGKADIEAKLLSRDEAPRIAANVAERAACSPDGWHNCRH
jgi:hypothetical protein